MSRKSKRRATSFAGLLLLVVDFGSVPRRMSYNPQHSRPGGPARPLIQRPRTSQPPPPPQHPSSALGSAVAGALGGMGYAWGAQGTPHVPQQAPWGPAAPYAGAPSHPSLPQAPHLASFYGQPAVPQQGFYGAPAAPGGSYNPYPAPAPVFQQPSAYPSSFYPPQQQQQHYQQQPPAYPAAPRTTAEGYTISSSYVAPLPSAAPPPAAAASRAPKSKGKGPKPKAERPPPPPPASFKCCKEDCGFTGGQRQVREHEEDRHLIFARGREPKPWAGSYKPKDGSV